MGSTGSGWDAAFGEERRRRPGGGGQTPPWGAFWDASTSGPPPWIGQLIGGWTGGGRPGGGRGHGQPRVRRGDVREAVLDVLGASDEPLNGYQVIQQIAERSHGEWKPSPGSVYPTISQLEDEGLIEDAPTGRRALRLTMAGREYVAAHAAQMAALWRPFDRYAQDTETDGARQVIGQTVAAIVQVLTSGTEDQRRKALAILADTRRRLYGLLAEGPEDPENATSDPDAGDPDVDEPNGGTGSRREQDLGGDRR